MLRTVPTVKVLVTGNYKTYCPEICKEIFWKGSKSATSFVSKSLKCQYNLQEFLFKNNK